MMTDPEIVRWLAEKVMGWELPERWRPNGPSAYGPAVFDETGQIWNPLTNARATEQVMEALRAKEYGFVIRHPASATSGHTAEVWHDEIIHWKVERDWKRAFCLAAVLATGGEV